MQDTLLSIVRFLFSGICHQLPERCLHYEGQALPLCARCTGTFLGILSALFTLWVTGQGRRSLFPPMRLRVLFTLLVALWGLDGINSLIQWAFGVPLLYEPHNSLRLGAGMGFGVVIGITLYPIYHLALWRKVTHKPVLEHERDVMAPFLAGAVWVIVLLVWKSAPFALWLLVVGLAVFIVFAVTNGTLIALLWHKEGFADNWPAIIPYLLAGLLATLAEMSALGIWRRLVMG